ncbi:thiamine phosphate synthase [Robinsoniella peoriensis]|uniref:thiamine phosphate synthase n=1 Tax=Robinsoniella peoriensis TaxID=180332 RepID=UPI003752CEFF
MYLCITNRKLCTGNFLTKIRELADRQEIEKIVLREKDLSSDDYEALAEKCKEICQEYGKPLVINQFIETAQKLQNSEVQISMEMLRKYTGNTVQQRVNTGAGSTCNLHSTVLGGFQAVGVSVHSAPEAEEAQLLGAGYLIAGHIFQTDCKKGIPGRGLAFLEEVCQKVSIPVYAIGGISPDNIQEVIRAGAKGGCMMSGFMR